MSTKRGSLHLSTNASGLAEAFTCVSRPRRFGKSVDADMLVAYYSKGCDSRALFEGLDISRDPSFETHLNAHHSALNIFTEYTVTSPKTLTRLFGFNADDVERLCKRFGMDYSEMAYWYDGYLLGEERIHVYNPRSVAGAIAEKSYSSFWTSTETYEALSVYIDMDFDGIARDLVVMLDGAHIPTNVGLFENSMTEFKSKDDVYALLVHLGYLGYDQVERTVFIPNEEIRREFGNAIEAGARPHLARLVHDSRELQRRTFEGDTEYVADAIERAHNSAAGPHYYNSEQALRAAVKLAYIWSIDDYLRIDELPGGRGYADLVFIPRSGSSLPPLVVELKWNQPVNAALGQIRSRNYPAALAELEGECVLVGITYDSESCEHSCEIECVLL
ncbi:MAG: AAA family ATPase [Atopobiaceae bacterium]|nr:AAA family ATPase [Atopobiaceae bacterium]